MSAKRGEDFRSMVEKGYGKEVANEIVGIIDRMTKEGEDPVKIQDEVTQYFLRLLKEDVNSAIQKFDHIPTYTWRHVGR